jgi:hypothetical protein
VRLPALIRAREADPFQSDPGALGLIIESLASRWTRSLAREALAEWLYLVQARDDPALSDHQLQALRRAVVHSLPYTHADFLIAALGALARMDDADARSAAEHVLGGAQDARGEPSSWRRGPQLTNLLPEARDRGPVLGCVRQAARACLNHLDWVREQEHLRGSLLTPADPPDDSLLRPAMPSALEEDATLVRPAEAPDEGG